MNSLVVVLAVFSIGCNANLIPLTYTGLPNSVLTQGVKTYTVQPEIQNINQVTQIVHPVQYSGLSSVPVLPQGIVSQAIVPQVPTQYVAQVAIPNTPIQSQFHQQDELGAYHFGHHGGPVAREEFRDHFGNVKGSYNYIDSEGEVQTTHYSAGPLGFKVAATNLPVAPAVPDVPAVELPKPVVDTKEVAQAKSAFKAAFDKVVADSAAKVADAPADTSAVATPVRRKRSAPVVAVHGSPLQLTSFLPNQFNTFALNPFGLTQFRTGLNTIVSQPLINTVQPVLYNAPTTTVQNAELLRVTNNPGHGESYRVLH